MLVTLMMSVMTLSSPKPTNMKLHDIIIHGPFGSVRMDGCNAESIRGWIKYGLELGATGFETFPSEAL